MSKRYPEPIEIYAEAYAEDGIHAHALFKTVSALVVRGRGLAAADQSARFAQERFLKTLEATK